MNYIQPTIIKLSDSEDIPTSLHNRYMINLNIVGLKYFQENFMIQENSNGDLIMKENYQEGDPVPGFAWLLEESLTEEDIIDIPRAYIMISKELVDDDTKLKTFIMCSLLDTSSFVNNEYGFVPGKDFFINETLYNYLVELGIVDDNEDLRLPNYLTKDGTISEHFEELDCKEKDYSNITYYYNKNKLADNRFSEDKLNDFYATFASIILEYTQIDDEIRATPKNQVYELVLKYFANHQTDPTSVALNLVLNTPYANLTNGTCGCKQTGCNNGISANGNMQTQSCYEIYISALKNFIKTMLGDVEFYNDWFTILMPSKESIVNDTLVEAIETLVHEFIGLGYDLSNVGKKKSKTILCGCSSISSSKGTGDYSVLTNFLEIMNWLSNCQLQFNLNKTKIYGEKLGEIFPYLQF